MTAGPHLEPTGIPHLDTILRGGVPSDAFISVIGPPGSGKTTLACQMAFAAARRGHKAAIFTALTEPTTKVLTHLRNFTFFDAELVGTQIQLYSLQTYMQANIDATSAALITTTNAMGADIVVLDGFQGVQGASPDMQTARQFLYEVGARLSLLGTTTIMTSQANPRDPDFFPEVTTSDIIFSLTFELIGHRWFRGLEVTKFRGGNPMAGLHALRLDASGIIVTPRLETTLAAPNTQPEVINTLPPRTSPAPSSETVKRFDLPEFDAMLGGGLTRETSTLLTGSLGVGKTLLALQFALAGIRNQERCVFLGFRETLAQLMAKADAFAMGKEFRRAFASRNLLTLIRWEPLDLDPNVVLDHLLRILDATGAQRLVIDSIAELQRAVTESGGLARISNFMIALLAALRQRQVTMLCVLEISRTVATDLDFTAGPLAILAENVILLQQVEHNGTLERVIAVLKMRFASHATTPQVFEIAAPEGIRILRPWDRP